MSDSVESFAGLKTCADPSDINSMSLYGQARVGENDLDALGAFVNLRELELGGAWLTPSLLRVVGTSAALMPKLKTLSIARFQSGSADEWMTVLMRGLAQCPQLTQLSFEQVEMDERAGRTLGLMLPGLASLQYLTLKSCNLSGPRVPSALALCPNLASFDFSGNPFTEDDLIVLFRALANHPSLASLTFDGVSVSETAAQEFEAATLRCPNLGYVQSDSPCIPHEVTSELYKSSDEREELQTAFAARMAERPLKSTVNAADVVAQTAAVQAHLVEVHAQLQRIREEVRTANATARLLADMGGKSAEELLHFPRHTERTVRLRSEHADDSISLARTLAECADDVREGDLPEKLAQAQAVASKLETAAGAAEEAFENAFAAVPDSHKSIAGKIRGDLEAFGLERASEGHPNLLVALYIKPLWNQLRKVKETSARLKQAQTKCRVLEFLAEHGADGIAPLHHMGAMLSIFFSVERMSDILGMKLED